MSKIKGKVVVICILGVISYSVINALSNPFQKLIYIYFSSTIALPIILCYIRALIIDSQKQKKIIAREINSATKKNKESIEELKLLQITNSQIAATYNASGYSYTKKENHTEGYKLLQERFNGLMHRGELDNSQVLEFLSIVNFKLGNHVYNYSRFNFENSAHEIYTKIKSSRLMPDDYAELYEKLNSIAEINSGIKSCISMDR